MISSTPASHIRSGLLVGLALLWCFSLDPASAQPTPSVDSFDLVLYGTNLEASHQVSLKTNPWRGDTWTPIGENDRSPACTGEPRLWVVRDLSAAEYLGQDIRENYIALRITTEQAGTESELRAAYALPAADTLTASACEQLTDLITSSPSVLRRHSVALHTRPQPAFLSAEDPFIEHLEAPIRHRKPGVMEVEWLEILFQPE